MIEIAELDDLPYGQSIKIPAEVFPDYPEWGHWCDERAESYEDHYYLTRYDDMLVALNLEHGLEQDLHSLAVRVFDLQGRRLPMCLHASSTLQPKFFLASDLTEVQERARWVREHLLSHLIVEALA